MNKDYNADKCKYVKLNLSLKSIYALVCFYIT